MQKFATFYGTQRSITLSKKPNTCPCPKPDESIPRPPPHSIPFTSIQHWDLRSSEILRSEEWQFLTDVSGQPIRPSVKGQKEIPWPLKTGPIRCPETSVRNYHSALPNIAEERRSELPLWSKSAVNAAAECDRTERQGPSIREAARRTLVTVCDMFQLVRCSQSVLGYGWEKVCFKVWRKSCITSNELTWNFV